MWRLSKSMSYFSDITARYIWTLLWRHQVLSYHAVHVLQNMFRGRNLLQHQPWNNRHSHLIATSAIPLSFQVSKNISVLSRQEQDIAILCPFPTLRTWLHHRVRWKIVVRLQHPPFFVLKNEGADNNWLFVLNLWFGEFNFIQGIVHMI